MAENTTYRAASQWQPIPECMATVHSVTEVGDVGKNKRFRTDAAHVFTQPRSRPAGRFRKHLSDLVSVSPQFISLDSCTHCAQGDGVRCEAPLAVPSLALPDPSQRDRFPSLRRCYTRVTVAALSPENAGFIVSPRGAGGSHLRTKESTMNQVQFRRSCRESNLREGRT